MVRYNGEFGRSCLRGTGELLGHTDTSDHDAARAALGIDRVSWLGISYGSQLAANYAELFPGRTRAMVLDSALEHSLPDNQQVADEILGVEASFNRFIAWCDTALECALHGQDVGAVYDRLVAGAERHPIPVDGASPRPGWRRRPSSSSTRSAATPEDWRSGSSADRRSVSTPAC
jgi:pimeloyl-ACP methyl ester carboxylesterase